MADAHHLQPLRRGALELGDARAHAIDQDLGAAAGQGVEAGRDQAPQHRLERQRLEAAQVQDLLGRQRVQLDRIARLQVAEQILVPLDAQLGVEPALQEDLDAAGVDGLLDLLAQLLARQHVGVVGVARVAEEGAEAAGGGADVGVVDVALDDVGDDARRG